MDQEVKQQYRYGSDIIYIMKDDTIIMKKSTDDTLILSPDDSMDIVNN